MPRRITKSSVLRVFNAFIRKRDTQYNGYAKCCSCGSIQLAKDMDCGHFVNGRGNGILFDERGCHLQCRKCNRFLSGNWAEYYTFMQKKYGQEVIEDLIRMKRIPVDLNLNFLYIKFNEKLKVT